jgi:beta-lactamase regulating signal transducer with metallopeptidase domain/HEAT repeat protein
MDMTATMALVLLVKATCLLLVALGVTVLLRQRASAGVRHLVWLVAVVGVLAMPAVAAWGPLRLRVLPAEAVRDVEGWTLPARYARGQGDDAVGVARAQRALPSAPSSALPLPTAVTSTPSAAPAAIEPAATPDAGLPVSLGTMLFAAWAIVALGLALHLAYGAWSVGRIVARARPLDDPEWQNPLYDIADRLELDAAPRLLRSDDVKMPFAAGLVSSVIVLPAESDGWSPDRRSAVLIHELGHVRRRDLVGHTLGRVACALWWFHPLVWTAARRLRAESERACDDLALVFGARPSDYAEHLLDIVSCVRDHNTPAVALAMAHRREFEGRMLAILDPELRRRGMGRMQTAGLVGGLAALALVVGAAAPVPRETQAAMQTSSDAQAPSDTLLNEPHVAIKSRDGRTRIAVTDSTSNIGLSFEPGRVRVGVSRVERGGHTVSANASASARASAQASRAEPAVASAIAIARGDSTRSDRRAEVLAKMLRTDTSAALRRISAWGLHEYGENKAAVEALAAAVAGDTNAGVREMAAWALAEADDNSAASAALIKALRQDKDARVRTTATWALGEVGDAGSVDALVPVLGDADAETRELAAWSIGECEPKKAPAALVSLLTDKTPDVRLSAAWALYQIEDGSAAGAIEAAYNRETVPEVREGLIRALGAMGDGAVDALQRLVTSPDPKIRRFAVTALAGGNASGPWPWPRPEPRPFPDVDEGGER